MMKIADLQVAKDFQTALIAPNRSPEIPEAEDAYGRLIGSWELDVPHYYGLEAGTKPLKGEVHFGWVLKGRAVQDVFIVFQDAAPNKVITYGTTLRVWKPSIRAWRVTWINPARNHREEQIGRLSGRDIVQIGLRPDGTPTRWMFIEIEVESFHWIGEALQGDGKTWKLEAEFFARRMH